jgi:LacI family transcriptional regulator
MAIRLKDIARELNVSVITVSKALRGNTDISEATRQRILTRMQELDYRPNLTARSLATGHSFIVGLIVPDLLNPFFTELAKSLGGELRKRSYGLILTSSEDDPEIERSEIRMMLARGVDALLIASCQPTAEGFLEAHNQRTPFVLLDRPLPNLRANFVGTDGYAGAKMATEHLIQIGRRRLAYLGCPELGPGADRLRGFRDTLIEHGIAVREDFIVPSALVIDPDDNTGYELMQQVLRARTCPNGVFCHNDIIAIGAMKAALDAGLSIPGEVAFVGYDNVRYAKYLHTPLTSIDQSTGQLGERAVQLALDLIARKGEKPQQILLSTSLIVRHSTVDGTKSTEDSTSASGKSTSAKSAPAKRTRTNP